MKKQPVIIHWGISSFYGWGVYGLNLALCWAADAQLDASTSFPWVPEQIVIDPLRRLSLRQFEINSLEVSRSLEGKRGQPVVAQAPLLAGLNNELATSPAVHGAHLTGTPTLGVAFFEKAQLGEAALRRARRFPLIVCGSSWNEAILRAHGVANATTALQGIDPALFHPGPAQGLLGGRFKVFSGGKLEARKGQDLVMAGFARFARRHAEAVLVTAWHSPWPEYAASLDASGKAAKLPFGADRKPDVRRWARESGLAEDQFVDLGAVPNAQMPPILREMDVALFPNRAEGGTNLVAMEAMACGVPCILSANTGHLDLIDGDNCHALERQQPLGGEHAGVGSVAGWGESSVEEIEEKLERAWGDRAEARRRGERGAAKLAGLTWSRTAEQMKRIVLQAI